MVEWERCELWASRVRDSFLCSVPRSNANYKYMWIHVYTHNKNVIYKRQLRFENMMSSLSQANTIANAWKYTPEALQVALNRLINFDSFYLERYTKSSWILKEQKRHSDKNTQTNKIAFLIQSDKWLRESTLTMI